jgi:hypothetical protein
VIVWRLNCGKSFVAPDRKMLRMTFLLGFSCFITANCSTEGAKKNFLFGMFFKEFPKSQSVLQGFE